MLPLILAGWLVFTLPSTGQRTWTEWDPDAADSVLQVECFGGPAIRQLETVELWGWPVSGGGFRLVAQHSAVGMEARPDSFPVPWPGLFYVRTRNPAGLSCASNDFMVQPDVTTAVGTPDETPREVVRAQVFDVQGRRVASLWGLRWRQSEIREKAAAALAERRLPSGVYFVMGLTRLGGVMTRRIAVVR